MIGATTTHMKYQLTQLVLADAAATWINSANIKELSTAPEESRDTSEDAYLR